MATITTTCEGCGRTLAIPERYQGRELKCPDCGRPFRAAAPEAPPALPPEPAFAASVSPDPAGLGPEPFPTAPPESPDAPPSGEPGPPAAVYWRVRRVGALSAAAMSAVVYALLGVLVGLGVAVASVLAPSAAVPFLRGPLLGVLAVVTLPLVYAGIGFVLGLVGAAVYNLAARFVGGVKLLLE